MVFKLVNLGWKLQNGALQGYPLGEVYFEALLHNKLNNMCNGCMGLTRSPKWPLCAPKGSFLFFFLSLRRSLLSVFLSFLLYLFFIISLCRSFFRPFALAAFLYFFLSGFLLGLHGE